MQRHVVKLIDRVNTYYLFKCDFHLNIDSLLGSRWYLLYSLKPTAAFSTLYLQSFDSQMFSFLFSFDDHIFAAECGSQPVSKHLLSTTTQLFNLRLRHSNISDRDANGHNQICPNGPRMRAPP